MIKSVETKNIRWWEWLIIAMVAGIVLFPKKVIAMVAEFGFNETEEGSVDVNGKRTRSFFRRLVQGILDELPFGGVINNIWNEIWN